VATHAQKEGQRYVSVWVPAETKETLKKLAQESGVSLHRYVQELLSDASQSGVKLDLGKPRIIRNDAQPPRGKRKISSKPDRSREILEEQSPVNKGRQP
jgi:hypothetical protein